MADTDSDEHDAVDRILAQWARERPELDTGPMSVIGRVHRVADLLEAGLRPVFAEVGLGNGDFDVLATPASCGCAVPAHGRRALGQHAGDLGRGQQAARPARVEGVWSSDRSAPPTPAVA